MGLKVNNMLKVNDMLSYKDDMSIKYDAKNNSVLGYHIGANKKQKLSKDEVLIDSLIVDLIVSINNKPNVKTRYCCSGHEDNRDSYIMFDTYNKETKKLADNVLKLYNKFRHKLINDEHNTLWRAVRIEIDIYENEMRLIIKFDSHKLNRKTRYELFNYLATNI